MSSHKAAVVSAARKWLGTPFCHQSSTYGHGVDCVGLLSGVWREVVAQTTPTFPPYSQYWAEEQQVEWLLDGLSENLVSDGGQIADGMVLVFRLRRGRPASHAGIVCERGSRLIHAIPRLGVVEVPLGHVWLRKIVGQFYYPEKEE